MKKIIGYGICGEGEASRYMKQTLECFKNLCDEVIILCNNTSKAEDQLIDSYGFKRFSDRREWGKWQWRIKQDFLERNIAPIANEGDVLVCLDMDEVLSDSLTKEWLLKSELDAYHVFIVDLWEEGFKPESCFWNVRLWKWNGNTKFKQKPVHCGLAPEWTYHYHRHAPFILKHYGLKDKIDRERKIKRYEHYDPKAEYLDKKFYKMLADDSFAPFDENDIQEKIAKEVNSYKQTKPRASMQPPKKEARYAYVKNPYGLVIDIPEKHLAETMKRGGFEFIGWADDAQKEIESLFEDVEIEGSDSQENPERLLDASQGSYQRSTKSMKQDFDAMNNRDDEQISGMSPIAPDFDASTDAALSNTTLADFIEENPVPKKKAGRPKKTA